MFEKFTDRARRVVVLSQEEARALDHHHIGTEHLLLGLVREGEAVAAQVLEGFGIGLDDARRQIVELVGRGEQPPTGHLPFTARAHQALELANRESMDKGLDYIGTEHLLLGLVREGAGTGAQALVKLGADPAGVARAVEELVEKYRAGRP
ncbi:Clp protease N-terminal domain-containing protein [Nonomuraea gerenzanensis]|uniref:ATP-dependent Clp protease, ATP-binding subunit ClpC / Negative regulator of genetic competence clcC/mecB n=1 Tax=Nonomuraea gerenzanensis TaxID=93944 RepID=A0A1M4DWE4_9ACTN|nr:Clp protease N-terminal domain-containing protein [Nonomuraea gerenzanensis]SBO90894.1 ATP-dependent Clp protease, ATP-binding subunit ClpC / Negative regulator of genetic competence clcC/mecB [Nonomuraea gerenzanensis]